MIKYLVPLIFIVNTSYSFTLPKAKAPKLVKGSKLHNFRHSYKTNNLCGVKITQRSKLNRFKDNNGRKIINSKYAGKNVYIKKFKGANKTIRFKYPKYIKFNKFGYPDFTTYAKTTIRSSKLTGNHKVDVKIAEKIAKQQKSNWVKRKRYTWHHHQDGKTMQYVPTDLHSAIPHSGGASRLRALK